MLRVTYSAFDSSWSTRSVVEDGRVTEPSEAGWLVRLLSPSGVERVRMRALETGLFGETADIPLALVADAGIECMDEGLDLYWYAAIELVGDSSAVVSWQRENRDPSCYEPSEARDALESLLGDLETMEAWLPADAWTDATRRPLRPHANRLITVTQPTREEFGTPPQVATVDWPLPGSLSSFGDAVASVPWAEALTVRCGLISPAEVSAARNALNEAAATFTDSSPSGFASATYVGDPASNTTLALILENLRPDQTSCEDLDLRILNCWDVNGAPLFYCAIT